MKNKDKAIINFKKYFLEDIKFKINHNFSGDLKLAESDIQFSSSVNINDEKNEAFVTLQCEMFKDVEENNFPFYLKVKIVGIFTFTGEAAMPLLEQNTLAILFPYLRAAISTITLTAGIAAVVLPPINIVEFLKNDNEKNNE